MSEHLWHCPFCNRDQTVTEEGWKTTFSDLSIENAEGPRRLVNTFVVCPNPECRKFTLTSALHDLKVSGNRFYTGKQLKTWALIPNSSARSFPTVLPPNILEDYQEACFALEFSNKVAAALARRCLSAMLRDFWQVQPGALNDEFRQIKGTVDPLTWEAIEAVRKNGMISSHMEQEGAEILDTDPDEAKLLIGLIETLIQDWYVVREERRKRLKNIQRITGEDVAENVTEE